MSAFIVSLKKKKKKKKILKVKMDPDEHLGTEKISTKWMFFLVEGSSFSSDVYNRTDAKKKKK